MIRIAGILFFALLSVGASAQPFINEIRAFQAQDSVRFPEKGSILFVGSSSFSVWKDVQSYFPNKPIVNRGFGGSNLLDAIKYADDIIFPYQPTKIVIYSGENDIESSDTVSSAMVAARFTELFTIIRQQLPKVPVVFVSIKPSPSRAHLMPRMMQANVLIRQFLKTQPQTWYVDVYHKMLDATGRPMSHIFTADSLHMNSSGYQIWKQALKKHL